MRYGCAALLMLISSAATASAQDPGPSHGEAPKVDASGALVHDSKLLTKKSWKRV